MISLAKNDSNKRETETSERKSQQDGVTISWITVRLCSPSRRALTFQYALYILRKQQLHFSNNFNNFLSSSRTGLCSVFYRKFKKGNCMVSKVRDGEESVDL